MISSYIDRRVPSIRRPEIITRKQEKVYYSGTLSVGSEASDHNWYPSSDTYALAVPNYESLGDNQEVIRYYNLKYNFEAETDKNPDLYIWKNGKRTKVSEGSTSGTVTETKLKYSVSSNTWILSRWFRLTLFADIDILDYNNITEPDDITLRNNEEEKAEYIFSNAKAKRYIEALLYSKDMEAKTYSFYSDLDLQLNEVCVINNLTQTGEYIRITDKQDNLDDFGGYEYKGTVYKGDNVSVSSSFTSLSDKEPYVNQDFNFSVSRNLIQCDANGNPLDSSAIAVKISLLQYYGIPTLKVGNTTLELTQDTETVEEEIVKRTLLAVLFPSPT